MNITLYGISNCDSVKKALNWFKINHISTVFHDFRKQPVQSDVLKRWIHQKGFDALINKKSTTWKSLSHETQQALTNEKTAIPLIMEHCTVIKRPVIEIDQSLLLIGYDAQQYAITFL